MIQNSDFIRALHRRSVTRTPVWVMRQAGRYLPEYRKVREQAGDFMRLCQTPDLACEVTLQPLRRFDLDAAILFSDILTIPDAMGLGLSFVEGEGPKFASPITTSAQIDALPGIDCINDLQYVFDAVSLIRKEMPAHLPLIGFSGSPWTLACYMLEGQSSREFKKSFACLYDTPESMHLLLSKLSHSIIQYLSLQIEHGVNAIMLFDTWGGVLPHYEYHQFSLHYMQLIIQTLKEKYPNIPSILFTKGGGLWLESMANTGVNALGIDWTCDLAYARKMVGDKVCLQGNLNPAALRSTPEVIQQQVNKILSIFDGAPGHIFNLGHGITPDVPPENLSHMIAAIRNYG